MEPKLSGQAPSSFSIGLFTAGLLATVARGRPCSQIITACTLGLLAGALGLPDPKGRDPGPA